MLVTAILLFLAVSPEARAAAEADDAQRVRKDLLGWDAKLDYPPQPRIDGAGVGVLKKVVPIPKVGLEVLAVVHYPDKTGNSRVDEQIREFAQTTLNEYLEEIQEGFLADDVEDLSPDRVKGTVLSTTFTLARSSSRYLSVIFYHRTYTGGAHPNETFSVRSFDLESGSRLAFTDLFPNGDAGPLTAYMNTDLDRQSAAQKQTRDQSDALTPEGVLETGLDNLALAPSGLTAIFAPYEQGPYSDGTKFVSIPATGSKAPKGLDTRFWPRSDGSSKETRP